MQQISNAVRSLWSYLQDSFKNGHVLNEFSQVFFASDDITTIVYEFHLFILIHHIFYHFNMHSPLLG